MKWRDVNVLLPGKNIGFVLVCYLNIDEPFFDIARFDDGMWFCASLNPFEDDATHVTHWTFLEYPL